MKWGDDNASLGRCVVIIVRGGDPQCVREQALLVPVGVAMLFDQTRHDVVVPAGDILFGGHWHVDTPPSIEALLLDDVSEKDRLASLFGSSELADLGLGQVWSVIFRPEGFKMIHVKVSSGQNMM
ncbi:hypothetical protein D3C72_857650 [compost metagenome]